MVVQNRWRQRYGNKGDNVFHALIKHRLSKNMWKLTKFEEDIKHLANQDMLNVLQGLTKRNIRDMELI